MGVDQAGIQKRLTELAANQPRLDVSTLEICFLALLHLRAKGAGDALSEDDLLLSFESLLSTLEEEAGHAKLRASHAIRRLREQKLLIRVDGAGVVRSGSFALSRLGVAIVEYFLDEEALTRENLTVLTRHLSSSLELIMGSLKGLSSGDEFALHQQVIEPLKIAVGDLLSGIEKRQRGLDAKQELFQLKIASLLSADWFGAIEQCQELLESTAQTLRELGEILLKDGYLLQSQLRDIESQGEEFASEDLHLILRSLEEKIDQLVAWGSSRQAAWSEYYEYVHRYLRDVVRLDPSRALSQRLRQLIQSQGEQKFALWVAETAPIRLLRAVKPSQDLPPVKRPKKEREEKPALEDVIDPNQLLKERVSAVLEAAQAEELGLSEVTRRVLEHYPEEERFFITGRVAFWVAKLMQPSRANERPWVNIDSALELEEWLRLGVVRSET